MDKVVQWRHQVLDQKDQDLDRLEIYLSEHPEVFPQKGGEISISSRLLSMPVRPAQTMMNAGTFLAFSFFIVSLCLFLFYTKLDTGILQST